MKIHVDAVRPARVEFVRVCGAGLYYDLWIRMTPVPESVELARCEDGISLGFKFAGAFTAVVRLVAQGAWATQFLRRCHALPFDLKSPDRLALVDPQSAGQVYWWRHR